MTPVGRILREKRTLWLPLLLVAVANVVAYLLGVAPLRARVAAMERRSTQATQDVRAATAQLAQTQGTVDGRQRATEQLRRFYQEVLPVDQAVARQLTYLDLAKMARAADLRVMRRSQELSAERESSLTRLDTEMVLEGSYANLREFIYEVETAPEFVVIDDVALAQGKEGGDLVLTLGISTYFRTGHGRQGL